MGTLVSLLGRDAATTETCDLSDELVEEIRMITALPVKEIHRIRRKYLQHAAQEDMSRDEFLALPALAINPLRNQIVNGLELTPQDRIPFLEFARFIALYSYNATQEQKLREAFRLHDLDGDGKISREDLLGYLALVLPPQPVDRTVVAADPREEKEARVEDKETKAEEAPLPETVVERVLEEASSDPTQAFLSFDDFVKLTDGAKMPRSTSSAEGRRSPFTRHVEEEDDTVVMPVSSGTSAESSVPGYDKLTTPSGDNAHHQPPAAAAAGQSQADEGVTEDLMHGINSFWAIVFPVCITMILASVVVVNYRNKNIEASMQTYLVFGAAEEQSGAEQIGLSLVNALVIIGAIAVLTFVMVLLYKFNCLKFLTGYIMFASAAILSFVGGQLVDSIINDQLKWAVDWPSFLFVMINFGFVGVVAIFYQKGIPKFIQNGYLVMVSVILAWQFSMWPEGFYRTFSPSDMWKADQVAEKFFESQDRLWLLIFHKYQVCSCSINMPCPVQARQEARRRQQEEDDDDKTIKLGLGDFIFYSVLVGRSAIFDFSTFAASFLCIVMGLGGTLFLLSVLHKALPALPISIFLATFFYFWTRYLFVDFCDFLMTFPAAV
ncbi:hypothetical protein ATCC90586_003411 [Pythium insidiosum]|nr:hypothetical protein ATCC90586_003411 [Pythium insidiosum]